jgi:glycosyltransferase involved in cell wall biosynthesis
MPLVSVIIPTYNRSRLVVEAVDGVLRQTVRDVEVIVVDDGSTDDTKALIESIVDKRVRYFYKQNGGVSTARNLGLKHVTGGYVCFLDSDDLWPPNFLEIMLDALGKNPDYGAAYCARTILYPDGTKLESYEKDQCKSGFLTKDLFKKTFIQTSTLCFRRNMLEGFSFDERLRNAQDVDAWLRLSTRIKYLFVPQIEILFRQDHGVTERVHHSRQNCNRILLLERFYFGLGGDKYVAKSAAFQKLSHSCRSVAEVMRKKGAKKAAIFLYRRAIGYKPLDLKLYIGLVRSALLSGEKDTMPDWQMPVPLDILPNSIQDRTESRCLS